MASITRSLARRSGTWIDLILGLLVTVICLFLYVRTVAPDVLGGDAGELQFVPYILSMTHPTGYPLLTLLGKLWTMVLPFGTVALRMNLLAAIFGALAVGLLYGAIRLATGSRIAACIAALLFGASDIYWGQAIRGDKYPLNAFFLALVLLTLLRWSRAPTSLNLSLCALAYGFSLTHHRSMLLFFPLLVGYVFWRQPQLVRCGREMAKLAALILLPLLLYLWLPVGASRGLPPDAWRPATLADWATYFLDPGYTGAVRPYNGTGEKILIYSQSLLAQFTPYGVALGLVGLAVQLVRNRALGVFLLLGFLLQAVLSSSYEITPERILVFFIPSFMLFAFWIAGGIAWLLSGILLLLKRWQYPKYALAGVALASFVVMVAVPLVRNYQVYREMHLDGGTIDIWRQELQDGYQARRFAAYSMAAIEPNSIIVGDWEQATPLWYLQQVEKQHPDLKVIGVIDHWQEAVDTGRPTYLARTLPGIGDPYHFTAVGPLVKVSKTPNFVLPPNITTTSFNWENKLELAGYRYLQTDFKTGYVLPVSLYFRALQPMSENYSLSVYLFAENGVQFWKEDRQYFALGTYSTKRWQPGEVVGDYIEVPFPRIMPAGRYRLGIVIYDSATLNQLTVNGTDTKMVFLPYFEVPSRQ